MKRVGANQDIRKYTIKLAGGAKIMDMNDTFQIGKRNVLAIKKALWALGTGVVSEDVGGTISRTVTIDLGTGVVSLSSPRREDWRL
jgi:chemotaxis protein CheD